MRWRRRAGGHGPDLAIALTRVEERLGRLDARLDLLQGRVDDVEDLAAAALAPDRVDELAARLDDLAAHSARGEQVVELQLRSARVANEVRHLADDLRREVDLAVAERLAAADPAAR